MNATETATQTVNPEDHIGLVYHIVDRTTREFPRHIDREDLVQVGMLGLMEATKRFDPEEGSAFSTFAGRRIEGAVLDHVRKDTWMPRNLYKKVQQLKAAEDRLYQGGKPTDEQIADELGVSKSYISDVRSAARQDDCVSLSVLLPASNSSTLDAEDSGGKDATEFLRSLSPSPADEAIRSEDIRYLYAAMEMLTDREREVVVAHFVHDKQLPEIASDLGIGVSRVSKLRQNAMERLESLVAGQYASFEGPPENRREKKLRSDIEVVAKRAMEL